MPWFAIRTVYHFGVKGDGMNVFEERIVGFEAGSPEQALTKAVEESDCYAADNKLVAHPRRVAYEQDGDPLIDGYELWSELFESPLMLEAFVRLRYDAFEFHPE